MQLQIAVYINSDVPGLNKAGLGELIGGFVQRLKGSKDDFAVTFLENALISPIEQSFA